MSTLDVTYGTPYVVEGGFSLPQCLAICEKNSTCFSAHFNQAFSKCELSAYYPPHGTLSAVPRNGWTVYYRGLGEVKGIKAWQSSMYMNCAATNGIDGQFKDEVYDVGCKCVQTWNNNSSWVMEFQSPGTVVMVTPFFRLQSKLATYRNTCFAIKVYNLFDDAKNDVNGALCIEYTGVGITSLTNFKCQQPVFGKALRIQHFLSAPLAFLQFCEVKVYTEEF